MARQATVAFEFSYSLTGARWAKAVVSDGEHRATVTASYLTDALRDLLDAVAVVAKGDSESRCLWTEEPGEFRWIFRRAHGDVEIEVIELKETYSRASDLEGTLRFRSTQPMGLVARRLANATGTCPSAEQVMGHSPGVPAIGVWAELT